MRILGEQRRKRDESEASVKRESLSRGGQEPRGGAQKTNACTHAIVQAVPAFNMDAATQLDTLHHLILECFSRR